MQSEQLAAFRAAARLLQEPDGRDGWAWEYMQAVMRLRTAFGQGPEDTPQRREFDRHVWPRLHARLFAWGHRGGAR